MAPGSRRALLECPAELRVSDDAGNTAILHRRALLGRGGFATVYEAQQGPDGPLLALKVISRALLSRPKDEQKLQLEIALHEQLSHHHIVRCLGHFVDENNIYLMLEHCSGVTVDDVVRYQGRLTEQQAAEVLLQVLPAVQYLHRRHILHRDLKLSNLLLDKQHRVKLSDFGLAAQVCQEQQRRMSLCGTLNYMAPEVLQRPNPGHGTEVDVWALGVMLYIMLVGQPPFKAGSAAETHQRIQAAAFMFPPDVPLSDDARSLISSILKTSPAERPSLSAIFRHPFLRRYRKRAAGGSPQASGLEPAASCDSWGSSLTASYEPPVGMPGAAWEVGALDLDHTPSTGPITPSSGWRGLFMPSSTTGDLLPAPTEDLLPAPTEDAFGLGTAAAAAPAAEEGAPHSERPAGLPSPAGSSRSLETGVQYPVSAGDCSSSSGANAAGAPGSSQGVRPLPGSPPAAAPAASGAPAAAEELQIEDGAGTAPGPPSPYSSCNTATGGMHTPVGSPQGGSSGGSSSQRLTQHDLHRRSMAWVASGRGGEGCGSSSGGSGAGGGGSVRAAPDLLPGRAGSLGGPQEGSGALALAQAGPSKQQGPPSSGGCEDAAAAAGKGRCDMCCGQPEPCLRCSYAGRCSASPAGAAGSSSHGSSSQPSPANATMPGLFSGAGASLSYLMPDVVASSLSQPTAGKRGDQVQQSLLAACSKQPLAGAASGSLGPLGVGPPAGRHDSGMAQQQQQPQQQQAVTGSQMLGLAGLSGTASAMTGFAPTGPWQALQHPWPAHMPGSPGACRQHSSSSNIGAAAGSSGGGALQRPTLPGLSGRSSPRCESPVLQRAHGGSGSGTVHSPVPPAVPPSPHQRHAAAARRRSLSTASPAPPSSPPGPAGLRTPKAAHVSFWGQPAAAVTAAAHGGGPQGDSPRPRWQTSFNLPGVGGMGVHLHHGHTLSNGSTGQAGGGAAVLGGGSSGGATPVSGFQMPPDFKAIRDQLQDPPSSGSSAGQPQFSSVAVLTLQPVFGSLSVCSTPSMACGSGSAGTTTAGSPLRHSNDTALNGEVPRHMRQRLSGSPAGTPSNGMRPSLADAHEHIMRQQQMQQQQRRQQEQQAAQPPPQPPQQLHHHHSVGSSSIPPLPQQQPLQQQRSMHADAVEQQAGESRPGLVSGMHRCAAPPHPPHPPAAAANSSSGAPGGTTLVPATPQTPRWLPHPPESERSHPVRASPAPPMQGKPVTASPAVARRTYTQVGTAASPRLGMVGGYMSPRAWPGLAQAQSLPATHVWPPMGGVLGQGSLAGMTGTSGSVLLGAPGELVYTPEGLTPELHRLGLPPPAFTQAFGLDVGHELGSPDDQTGEQLSPFSAAVVAQPLLRAAGFNGQAARPDLGGGGGGSAMLELREVIQRGQELRGLSVSCVRPPVPGLCAASFNLLTAPDHLAPVRVGPAGVAPSSGGGTPVTGCSSGAGPAAGHGGLPRQPGGSATGVTTACGAPGSSGGVLEALRGVLSPADRAPEVPQSTLAGSAAAPAGAAERVSPRVRHAPFYRMQSLPAQPVSTQPAERPPASPVRATGAGVRPPDAVLVPCPPGQAVPVCSSPCIRRLLDHCANAGSAERKEQLTGVTATTAPAAADSASQ